MRFPWQRMADARDATQKAQTEYEWAVSNRTTVSSLVTRLKNHGSENAIVEKLAIVARGGHK